MGRLLGWTMMPCDRGLASPPPPSREMRIRMAACSHDLHVGNDCFQDSTNAPTGQLPMAATPRGE
eukprot:14331918-Alexandrium_andersonii.AAC.1